MTNATLIKSFFFSLLLITCGCIGTDLIDDPIVAEKIEIAVPTSSLLVGETVLCSGVYFNAFGIEETVALTWRSSNSAIATVDANGTVEGVAQGQVNITAHFMDVASDPALITIVLNENDVAQVQISVPKTIVAIGETIQLETTITNSNDEPLTDKTVSWSSSNNAVATIDAFGMLEGISKGTVEIVATVDGVASEGVVLTIGSSENTAILHGESGYTAKGEATLSINEDGDLILTLSNDFETSFALGTFVYLANSTTGSAVKANGLDLGEISTGGAHTFNISDFDSNATLETYAYIVILCKPASITFGFGEFN